MFYIILEINMIYWCKIDKILHFGKKLIIRNM